MKAVPFTPARFYRLLWLLWLLALACFVAVALYPVSNGLTRAAGLGLLFGIWAGLAGLLWRWLAWRMAWIGFTVLAAGFLCLPARTRVDADALRRDYVAGLRRYEGVNYYWGGESLKGIDCSGLVRCGMMNAMAWRGLVTCDGGLFRQALTFWWHDVTARSLGEQTGGITTLVTEAHDINTLDHTKILAGDLAVVADGIHVMAYLGDGVWIEADPGIGRVITAHAPSADIDWFRARARIVRWRILSSPILSGGAATKS
jgi:hypothetical protein